MLGTLIITTPHSAGMPLLFGAALWSVLVSSVPPVTGEGNDEGSSPPISCNIYLAESTIPNAGLGIFTAVELNEGDTVGHGDVCLPIIDFSYHQGVLSPFEAYTWAGEHMYVSVWSQTKDNTV